MSMQLYAQAKTASAPTPAPAIKPARTGLPQRKCACCDTPGVDGECAECRAKRLSLQRGAAAPAALSHDVPPIVHDALASPGHSLDAGARAFIEPRFGTILAMCGCIRMRKQPSRRAESMRLAYTVGKDMVFGQGQYGPGTSAGKRLTGARIDACGAATKLTEHECIARGSGNRTA